MPVAPDRPADSPAEGNAEESSWQDLSIPVHRANVLGVPIFLVCTAGVMIPYIAVHGPDGFGVLVSGWALVALVAGVVAHEGLHALGWIAAGVRPSDIRFGVFWKMMTPYAHSRAPMPARAYRLGCALPGVAIGLVPAAAGIAAGSLPVAAFGAFFLAGAGGDFLVLWMIRHVEAETLVKDHSDAVGCLVASPPPIPGRAAPPEGSEQP